MSKFCDSCLDAAMDEGVPEGEENILFDMGADIADHLCDQIESDGDIVCRCACHPDSKRNLPRYVPWSGKVKDLTPDVVAQAYQKSHGTN